MSTVPSPFDSLNKEWSTQKMNSHLELCWEEVEKLVDIILFEETGKYLNNLETTVLRGSYEGKTYKEMSGIDYQTPTLQEAGAELWENLSKALEERVKKTNFVQALKRYKESQAALNNNSIHTPLKASQPEATSISVERANNSDEYIIERPKIETFCKDVIEQNGALIRIRALPKMGKTILLNKLLNHAREELRYKTAKLDLQLADSKTLTDLKSFLQWLCFKVSNDVGVPPEVEENWKDFLGMKLNCDNYFQNYLLVNIQEPLVLAIDSFEYLFEHYDVFSEFCSLLRFWHEEAKRAGNVDNVCKKLRIVLVYSNKTVPDLDINYSPFNVGELIELPDFSKDEVEVLVEKYHINEKLKPNGLTELMDLIGGHPKRIQQALISLKREQTDLKQLLELAPTEQSIFRNYLLDQLSNLEKEPEVKSEYQKVLEAITKLKKPHYVPNKPERKVMYKLESMGLVKSSGNRYIPRYQLDIDYFRKVLE